MSGHWSIFPTGARGVVVDRIYSGSFMTSLQMAGFSVTVLHVTDEIKSFLGKLVILMYGKSNYGRVLYFTCFQSDFHTSAPAWQKSFTMKPDVEPPSAMPCGVVDAKRSQLDAASVDKGSIPSRSPACISIGIHL